MKQKVLILFAALLALSQSVWAYDFSYTYQGNTLYYTISGSNVIVTYPASYSNDHYYGYTKPSGDLVIPSTVTHDEVTYSVTSIGSWAFDRCSDLTSVTIPDGVTSIGSNAFQYCSGLTYVAIGSGITSIGGDAFKNCSNLTSITIPDGVTSLGSNAFQGCSSLISATIGNGVTSIGTTTFQSCSSLTSVTIGSSVTSIGNQAFDGCRSLTSIIIPDGVTSIGNYSFRNCSGLISVTIGSGVTSIGSYAFSNCSSSRLSISIPNDVSSIDIYAFKGVHHIEYYGSATGAPWDALSMNGFTEGDYVFSDDSKHYLLAYLGIGGDVTIPSTVDTIGENAFRSCGGLTSITLGSSVTSIGNSAFSSCGGLTSITLGSGVASIGNSAFSSCNSLTSVNIPDGVTSIGNNAFYSCIGLTSITIGSGVTSIGNNAFKFCSSLNKIYSFAMEPPSLGGSIVDVFGSNITPVYVYCDALEAYQSASGWSNFINYRGVFPYSVSFGEPLHGSVDLVQPTCDNPEATLTANPDEGYTFVRWSDGCIDNPRTLTLTSDTVIDASFEISTYNVTVSNALGGGIYTHGSTAVLAALPQVNGQFVGWSDGEITNPRSIVVTSNITLDALFSAPDTIRIYDTVTVFDTVVNVVFDTVINIVYDTTEYNHFYFDTTVFTHYIFDSTWVFDTIYYFDTIYIPQTGIGDVGALNAQIYISNGQIVVDGTEGNPVWLYDINGRLLATKRDNYNPSLRFDVQNSGTYLVKIGNLPARRVVVIR